MLKARTTSLLFDGLFMSGKIPIQNAAIDSCQFLQIRHPRAFIDRVHGLAGEAKLDHRTIAADKARGSRDARCGELGLSSRRVLARGDGEIGEGSWLGDEHVG